MFTGILDEALDGWSDVRNGVIAEVENIAPGSFDFRPDAGVRNVRELVQHILEVSLMMTGELTRPDTNLKRAAWPKLLAMYSGDLYERRAKRELLALLRSSLRDGVKKFRAAGELHMLQLIERFDGEQGTRLAWFHHGVEQEMYHRGQLATYQRLMGVTPALTKRITGED